MRFLWFAVIGLLFAFSAHANGKGLEILVTISPIYSLVKNVSGDLNNVNLLISSNASPHHYQLKPSDAKKIAMADVIFIVDENFEIFLTTSLSNEKKKKLIALSAAKNIKLLPSRKEVHTLGFIEHNHDHEHEHEHDHNCNHHSHGNMDLHYWASPYNAKAIIHKIAEDLSNLDPDNKQIYSANANSAVIKIDQMDQKITSLLAGLQDKKFLVFHDGYQYFEEYYHLHNAGTVVNDHNSGYGAKTFNNLANIIEKEKIQCIFAEPEFSPHLVNKIAKSSGIKVEYMDIEGANLIKHSTPENLYFSMMEQNAVNFAKCLK